MMLVIISEIHLRIIFSSVVQTPIKTGCSNYKKKTEQKKSAIVKTCFMMPVMKK